MYHLRLVQGQEMLVEHQLHTKHCLLDTFGRQLAFPHHDDLPTVVVQHLIIALVALLVSLDFVHPKLPIRLRNLAALGTLFSKL